MSSIASLEVDARYREMTKGLNAVNVAGATAITALTLFGSLADPTAAAEIAAIQFPVVAFNALTNLALLPRYGVRAELTRIAVNLGSGLLVADLTDWSLPNFLWQPYLALAFDQFGLRSSALVVSSFCIVQDVWALADGAPAMFVLGAGLFTAFCWNNAKVRFAVIRDMVVRADGDRAALASANQRLADQIRATEHAELELRHAQKLEAVGRLAAGLAHEMNTPLQFVGDSLEFVRRGAHGLVELVEDLRAQSLRGPVGPVALESAAAAADFTWIADNLPAAADTAADGLRRMSEIVRAMKKFARADAAGQEPADLAESIRSVVAIASSEYRSVAELAVEIEPLPPVVCHVGEINQVLLALLVNAAQAIEKRVARTGGIGAIAIRAAPRGNGVSISFTDTGDGIPPEIRGRVFEPFFTTKAAGTGGGQGLAISRAVVERHGGRLAFETQPGVGTTFELWLPAGQPREESPSRNPHRTSSVASGSSPSSTATELVPAP